ncbi:endo alpha-1,4 polygalactosaminidase [Demequina sp.]|uniref:endo alpha-1,4 polygalactosaminidase n=1 Tax=Demequina sp. TaxID=2050685 RepID=UPI003D1065F1
MRVMVAGAVAGCAVLLSGCVANYTTMEFPTWTPEPNVTITDAPTAIVQLPPDGGLDYQLGGAYEPPDGTAIVARDSTDTPAPGLYNICYLNGFQSQPGEAGKWDGLLLEDANGPVTDPGWPDEFLLDTSTPQNRKAIAEALEPLMIGCQEAGFQAVEFDNLDSYTRSDGALTQDDNLALAAEFVEIAHRAGLAAGQKNGAEIVAEGAARGFDFAVTEECGHYDECGVYQEHYATVLNIEYGTADEFRALCEAGTLPPQTVRRDRNLATPSDSEYVFERCD